MEEQVEKCRTFLRMCVLRWRYLKLKKAAKVIQRRFRKYKNLKRRKLFLIEAQRVVDLKWYIKRCPNK